MTTLIVGGASQTGVALAALLREANHPVIFASRSGRVPDGYESVKFDWMDPSTFKNPFDGSREIRFVYLVAPDVNPLPIVTPFMEIARNSGVEKFILLSGSAFKEKENAIGVAKIHAYLDKEGLNYVALRPTGFTDNLKWYLASSIKEKDVIETIIPTGRIAFIAVEDIAKVAFDAIVNPSRLPSNEPIILGPEYLTYNEVAEILSEVLGRKITHRTITKDQVVKDFFMAAGAPEELALMLADCHERYEKGEDEKWAKDPRTIVGKTTVREWVERNKEFFTPSN